MTLRFRFALGLILVLVIHLCVGLWTLDLYRQSAHHERALRETGAHILSTALAAQVQFRTQIQEWKNMLLRGQDSDDMAHYRASFEQAESHTRLAIETLIGLLHNRPEACDTAERFLHAHQRLGTAYRRALTDYDPGREDAYRLVDQQVQGIDREPGALLDAVVASAQRDERMQLEALGTQRRAVEARAILLMSTLMSTAVLALLWLLDHRVAQPIAAATAIARRISAGDFSTSIQARGTDEAAQMLLALKHMQRNLAASQERLRQSEARVRLLLESTGEGIYGVDTKGRCIFCNPAAARLLGFDTPEHIKGEQMHALIHHSRHDGHPYPTEDCKACLTYREGRPARVEDEVFWRPDGSQFPVEYHANPMYRDGNLIGAVVTFSDISKRKHAEHALRSAHAELAEERAHLAERVRERTAELDQANARLARSARAKDEFLAAMSHELRTPLTSILGLSETLTDGLMGPLREPQQRALHTIHDNGAHLLELINDILDMSRVASGHMTLRWDWIPLEQLTDAALRMTVVGARRKSIEVSLELDPAVHLIRGDGRRLKQLLINLLGNAVKFTPDGGRIGLEVRGDAERGELRFTVWDTGVGIAPDQRERLFEPFVQLDSRPAREYDGTGLGLALASGMAQLHGGHIELESTPGAGSRFEVILPWDGETGQATAPTASPDGPGDTELASGPSVQVLLVEDNASNREMIAEALRARGCLVRTAGSGTEALELAGHDTPDIILMDVQMPGMDGLETTRRLRTQAALRRVPIIALTALAMPGDREHCLEAGMDDYLSKPVGLGELHTSVLSWVRRMGTSGG